MRERARRLLGKVLRARREGRLAHELSSRFVPLARGARYLLRDPASNRVRLHSPDYVTPGSDARELELVGRIFRSFRRMKEDQERASTVYRPSPLWQAHIDEDYSALALGLSTDDIRPFHFFLANFGTWKSYHGVESTTLIRDAARSRLKGLWLRNDLFLGELRLWQWFKHDRTPLERLSYPRHGNQAGCHIDGVFVGPGSFFNDIYGEMLAGLLEGIGRPVVADLGAGYGKLAYFMLRDLERSAFVDFDLPETLCLAAYYLMKVWPEKRALLYGEEGFGADSLERYDLVFMPAYEIDKLPDRSVDLFINKNSLGEMTAASVLSYVRTMARATGRFFFHLNHDVHRNIYADGSTGLLGHEYPVPLDEFRLIVRYPDVGHLLHEGYADLRQDLFFYLYERRDERAPEIPRH